MTFHFDTIAERLRLLTIPVEGTKAVTVLIFVAAGSRYESERERGIAHFLEHMFFKGGAKYDTPLKVSETIDSIGGDFNAFTGKEYAGYYVKCASEQKEIAFDVLSDMLLRTKLASEDIEREKGVILEELNMYQDTPMYQIGWDFEHLLYGDTPMGRDQIGLPETITSFTSQDFVRYRSDLYTADNTVVVVSGDIDQAAAKRLTAQYFAFHDSDAKQRQTQTATYDPSRRIMVRHKKTEQGHLIIGFPGFPFGHEDEIAARLLAIILGGGMSSRMFTEIREQRGLCYSISTSTDHYSDTGIISTHVGVDLKRVEEAIGAIMEQYSKMAKDGPTETEVLKAKNYLKGKLTLRLEDSEELASYYGVQEILGFAVRSPQRLYAAIDAITVEDIARVARTCFVEEQTYLAAIGSFGDDAEKRFASLMHFA